MNWRASSLHRRYRPLFSLVVLVLLAVAVAIAQGQQQQQQTQANDDDELAVTAVLQSRHRLLLPPPSNNNQLDSIAFSGGFQPQSPQQQDRLVQP